MAGDNRGGEVVRLHELNSLRNDQGGEVTRLGEAIEKHPPPDRNFPHRLRARQLKSRLPIIDKAEAQFRIVVDNGSVQSDGQTTPEFGPRIGA